MDFRTEISIAPSSFKIGLHDPILTMGSCFSDSIGKKFQIHGFQTSVNPFGTTYHPMAIHRLMNYAVYQEYPAEHTYLVNNEVHLNYNFHSSLRSLEPGSLRKQISESIAACHYFIKRCKVLMITYGTAWVYERTDTGEGVANCHKMPASMFTRRLVPVEEIVQSFLEMHRNLLTINPDLRIILTVSPVRHTRDTLPLNSVSKAILRVACHQLASTKGIEYFPAFEIMTDDLRDYRFYGEDMIHPTTVAEEYIWERFKTSFFEKETLRQLDQWTEVLQRLEHKAFNPSSAEHIRFLNVTLHTLNELKTHFAVDDLIKELEASLRKLVS